jgi:hypothetical protein
MTIRWKRRLILVLALITLSSVPLPNVSLPSFVVRYFLSRSALEAALQESCRMYARMMQNMASAPGTDVASLETRVWEPIRKHCGEWRP